MPVNWIERTFQPVLTTPADQLRLFPVWLLLGPRQVGKSSLLHKCARGHAYVNLDDLTTRERANRDPALFVRELRPPFTIDEIQYAPRLLSPIKQLVDAADLPPGAIRLTGSQNFQVMEGVTETLAGPGSPSSICWDSPTTRRGFRESSHPTTTSDGCSKPDSPSSTESKTAPRAICTSHPTCRPTSSGTSGNC